MIAVRWGIAGLLLGACTFAGPGADDNGDGDGDIKPTPPDVDLLTMTGTVVDFVTGEPVTGATIEGVDLSDGQIEVDGATFSVSGMLPFSIFRLKVTTPTHETTISRLLAIDEDDVDGMIVEVVPPSLIDEAYDTTSRGRRDGLIIANLVDGDSGLPMVGVAAGAFPVGQVIRFMDSSGAVSSNAPSSLDSGVAFLMNVNVGLVELVSELPEHTFLAPLVRVEDNVVTLVDIDVGLDPPPLPTGVTFEQGVVGVFSSRGCAFCHRDTFLWDPPAGFDLGTPMDERYDLVLQRVDLMEPTASLLLRKPSFEDPPDGHQIVFANRYDADRMIFESWILDGAPR